MNALYIHIPFCEKKCFYCSFVVAVGQQSRIDQYLQCLAQEAHQFKDYKLKTIFVGGGTPTSMNHDQLTRLVKILKENFQWDELSEVTIEANPEGLTYEKAKHLHDLGFNRVSLGVQSFNDQSLKHLGRCHDRAAALRAFENLRKANIKNINIDLMYCFAHQTRDELTKDLKEVMRLHTDHVSLYALSIEENSKFFVQSIPKMSDDREAEFYRFATGTLEGGGLKQYEISNFAREGQESQHNINYWRGGSYIGLGVSAHSHFNGQRWWNVNKFMDYIKRIEGDQPVKDGSETLSPLQRFVETLLFGLRMNAGVCLSDLKTRFRCDLDDERKHMIDGFVQEGFLQRKGSVLQATKNGRVILDEICTRLV